MKEILIAEFNRFRIVFFHYGKIIVGGMCLATIFLFIYASLKTDSLSFNIIASIFTTIGALYLFYYLIYSVIRFFKDNKNPIFTSFAIIPDFDLNLSIIEQLKRSAKEVKKTDEQMREKFDFSNESESKFEKLNFITFFDFPVEIETPASQYLLYFGEFLRDLGINTTSNLKKDVGKILFSVTPTDEIEALDKIREALTIYLNLPASSIVFDDSYKSIKLQQQIEHLQYSQRMAALELQLQSKLLYEHTKMIDLKNLTISEQQTIIEQQNKIIEKITSKSIMIDAIENKEEFEEIYEGLKIGKSKFLTEQLGISLNPTKIVKSIAKTILEKDSDK